MFINSVLEVFMKLSDQLSQAQINRRVEALRPMTALSKVRPGWIRYMREALGMTLKTLGARAGLATSTIQQAERNEAAQAITLKSLSQIAEAMDCELVYAFVPKSPIAKVLEAAANSKAKRLLEAAGTHMELENQKVEQNLAERIARLAKTLLDKGDIW
jgi:predicted DNA-binding mobile mystery protein A